MCPLLSPAAPVATVPEFCAGHVVGSVSNRDCLILSYRIAASLIMGTRMAANHCRSSKMTFRGSTAASVEPVRAAEGRGAWLPCIEQSAHTSVDIPASHHLMVASRCLYGLTGDREPSLTRTIPR